MMTAQRPDSGCFHAAFPRMAWEMTPCRAISVHAHPVPRLASSGALQTTGNRNDYVLSGSSLINSTTGSFPSAKGFRSESSVGVPAFGDGGILGANEYTLQINTNDNLATSACSGGAAGCTVWQQFVYATDYGTKGQAAVFIEYWLLGYGKCPSGYTPSGNNCYINSSAASAPDVPLTGLGTVQLAGTATSSGDSVIFFTASNIYGTSAPDTVLNIATVWRQSEFNVFGDAGGSEAVFNPGASLTVNVAAPTATATCVSDAGTTGETSNLVLSPCFAAGGSTPSILFREFAPTNLNAVATPILQLLL
jgi:hypothetical protein